MTFKKRVALVLATCMIVASLSACGEKGGENGGGKSNSPIPASEAFAQKGIWFYADNDEPLTKDTPIKRVLEFDGKGNVSSYFLRNFQSSDYYFEDNFTFGDLRDLSDEKILELAKESDKALIEARIQVAIEEWKSAADQLEIEYYSGNPEKLAETEATLPEARAVYEAQMINLEQLEYIKPEARPVTLNVKTDGTGNQTSAETLTCTFAIPVDTAPFSNWMTMEDVEANPFPLEKSDTKIELSPSTAPSVIYDMQFMGLDRLYQRVKEGHPGFTVDAPDTKGVKVD